MCLAITVTAPTKDSSAMSTCYVSFWECMFCQIFFCFLFLWKFDFFINFISINNSCILSRIFDSVFHFLFTTFTCINYMCKILKTQLRAYLKIIAYLSYCICNAVGLYLKSMLLLLFLFLSAAKALQISFPATLTTWNGVLFCREC